MAETWTLELGADVVLRRASGIAVDGLPQKARAALAVLALLDPEPVSRRRLGEILWPSSSPEQRLVSLRQALASVRKQLGGEAVILASRTSLSLEPERVRVIPPESGALLNRFTEPWFVLLRSSRSAARQVALRGGGSEEEGEAVRSLTNLLHWTVQHQADNAFGLIYHALDLATSIPGSEALPIAEELLRRSSPSHPMRGWGSFFKAIALFFTNETEASRDEFHRVRLAAASQGNSELMVMSAFHEAGAILPMGDLATAQAILEHCQTLKPSRSRPRAAIRLDHGLGLVAACQGDYKKAFARMKQAGDTARMRGERYEQAYVCVNCAWIAASVGEQEIGHQELWRFEEADTGGSYRFEFTSQLARIHLHCGDNDPMAGASLGEAAIVRAQTLNLYGLEAYVRESVARCYRMLDDMEKAREEVRIAQECRAKAGWAIIPWDQDRLNLALEGRLP